jgi:hypothetical protein
MCINDCGSPVLPATVLHIRISNIFAPGSGNRDPGLPNAEPDPVKNKSIPKAEIYFDRRSFQRKRSNFSYIFFVSSLSTISHNWSIKISFYQRVSLQFKNKYPRDLFYVITLLHQSMDPNPRSDFWLDPDPHKTNDKDPQQCLPGTCHS